MAAVKASEGVCLETRKHFEIMVTTISVVLGVKNGLIDTEIDENHLVFS